MKPIEGIDLGELVKETENEILAEKRVEVRRKVSGIVLNLAQWKEGKKRALAEADKYDQKIAKGEAKLKAIREGKWEVLEDDQNQKKDQGNQQKGKAQAAPDDEDD